MAGMQKAAVLPEPVSDWPTRSCPCMISGIAAAWIGAVSSKPSLATARSNSAERPSESNDTWPDCAGDPDEPFEAFLGNG